MRPLAARARSRIRPLASGSYSQSTSLPPTLPGLRVVGGHVVLALARNVESRFLQRVDDVGAALHDAVLDALHEIVPDDLARVGLDLQAGPQLRRVDVNPVAGVAGPGASRVVGLAPAVLIVEGVAQRTDRLVPAGRRDVEALPRLIGRSGQRRRARGRRRPARGARPPTTRSGQARDRPTPSARTCRARPRSARRPVLGCPRDHAVRCRGVLVLERQRIGDGGDCVGIAAANLDALAELGGRTALAEQVVGGGFRRAGAAGDDRHRAIVAAMIRAIVRFLGGRPFALAVAVAGLVAAMVTPISVAGQFTPPSFPCTMQVDFYNKLRRLTGTVNAECYTGRLGHSAPFGNWGVRSNYGQFYDGHQFSGWKYGDGWKQWNSCTTREAAFRGPSTCGVHYNDGRITSSTHPQISLCSRQKASPDSENRYARVFYPVGAPDSTQPCSYWVPGVQVFSGLRMELYELDAAPPFTTLASDSDFVTTLRYPTVTVPISCTGGRCSGESRWYAQQRVDNTGVTAQIKVRVAYY